MGKKGMVLLLSCVFALSLALFGCGGNNGGSASGSSASFKEAFVGTWDLVEMRQDDQVTSPDDLETLRSLGLEVYVNLNADGTATLVKFGEPVECSWDATSATEGVVTVDGTDDSIVLENSRLTFNLDGATMVFEKGEPKEAPASASNGESNTTPAQNEASAAVPNESASEANGEPASEEPTNDVAGVADEAAESDDSSASEE